MTTFRFFLKNGLYLAAILLLPGALIGAPLLWWLGHRNAKSIKPPPSTRKPTYAQPTNRVIVPADFRQRSGDCPGGRRASRQHLTV